MLYYILFNDYYTPKEAVIVFLITIFVYLISLSLHEFAHSYTAYKMGDSTPKISGRLTLNPFKHLSMSGFLMFVLLGIGWAKPVPINSLNFKNYRKGIRLVSISGILTNFLLGLLCAILYSVLFFTVGYVNVAMEYVFLILQYFMIVNSFLALFNLIPVYPMDGFNFVTSFMRADNKYIKFNVKNGLKILFTILLVIIIIELLFSFDLLDWYLTLLYNYVYLPICFLGV